MLDLTLDRWPLPEVATPPEEASFEQTLLHLFDATVLSFGGRLAIDAPDSVLDYAAFDALAGRLADYLRAGGVGPGDRVAVRVPSGSADLYVSILGVLKAGAAYVPIDADDPPARAEHILSASGACAAVGAGLQVTWVGVARGREDQPTPDDEAWVIFTSGSTGAPKGVAVTHRSAAAFVNAETELWRIRPSDRVLAGLSVAFDASCEEMWLAWGHGAALVPAPRELVRSGVELGPWLSAQRVSVISTVPTLAAIWDESSLDGVRLVILGGEACPDELAWRLARGREVWNTYGPTEATVVSTAARLRPGVPVTIGEPLRGWEVAVVDARGEPVVAGEPGELVIAGVGLGRYLDPALDAERFRALEARGYARAYRTGDIVRETADGLVYIGRRDHQVKIDGRRIELGEVDAALTAVAGVRAACTVVRKTAAGNDRLVAYVSGDVEPRSARESVAGRLPAGLAPMIVVLDELPIATSGKVLRSALPWPPPKAPAPSTGPAAGEELSDTARWLRERWIEQLGPVALGAESDFFELGGSSLAAAKLASVVRERYPAFAVADVYHHRRLGQLIERLQELHAPGEASPAVPATPASSRRLGAMQLVGLLVLLAVEAVPFVLATVAYGNLVAIGTPHVAWLWLGLAWALLASPPAHTVLQVACARALLRGLTPGRYPRASWLACRLWFVDRLAEATRFDRLGGTPWADRYARLVGTDVGPEARLATVPPSGALLHIGAGATIEADVDVRGWWVERDEIVVGEITVGAGARIGSRTLLHPGAVVGEGAEVEPGSVVWDEVPAGERWGGAPARHLGSAGEDWPAAPAPVLARGHTWEWLFPAGLVFEGLLAVVALAPAIGVLALVGGDLPTLHSSLVTIFFQVTLLTAIAVPTSAIVVALTLRAVWRLARPGWHSDQDVVGWALWFAEELKTSASTLLFPMYASLFTRPWFRLMGLKVGRRTEVSVSTGLNPLVSFGEYSQCTDDVGFCGVRSRDGWLSIDPISVGDRSFLGPGAILRGGTRIGDRSLVGVMTLAPREPADGTSWLGVPALELPRVPDCADPTRTVDPPRRLILARGVMDVLRLLGPNTLALFIEVLEIMALAAVGARVGLVAAIAAAPLILLAGGLSATAVTVALKWLVIGRYRRSEHPLWCGFVWRDELMNATQEQLADEFLLRFAIGTPVMSAYLRAMGSRIGRGVWCEITAVTEYDMIELGDGVAVNRQACLMTHLFQDRVLRIGPTCLAPGATLGPTAVVLPDTRVGAGTVVCGHSVVLRGEELPPGTRWHSTPVVALPATA